MSRSKQYTFGVHTFRTKTEAQDFIKALLNRLPLKEPIGEPDHSFLSALVANHKDARKKIGVGIRYFTVEPAKGGTRCFYLTRVDGTRDDFSTNNCFGSVG